MESHAALLKGGIMALFGTAVLIEAVYKAFIDDVPAADTMGLIGTLAFFGNGICLFLLFRHRSDDLNMRSTWLCSRNDIVANIAVLSAAGLVKTSNSHWPDIMVGTAIAALFLKSAFSVLRDSISELQVHREPKYEPGNS